jgi:hypothetical protein
VLKTREPELAAESLLSGSDELLRAMARPEGPFDEEYIEAKFEVSSAALEEAEALYEEADQASALSERFSLSSTILAVGLGATAWAGFLREKNGLRFVFAVTAVVALITGLVVGFNWRLW